MFLSGSDVNLFVRYTVNASKEHDVLKNLVDRIHSKTNLENFPAIEEYSCMSVFSHTLSDSVHASDYIAMNGPLSCFKMNFGTASALIITEILPYYGRMYIPCCSNHCNLQ